jgi:hypothetical protein
MTGSSIPRKLLPVLAAFGWLTAGAALAQTPPPAPPAGGPTKLAPLPDQPPPGQAGPDALKPPLNALPPTAPPRRDGPIEVERLAPADPDGFGLSDPRETVFGNRQWNGTSKAMATALVARLPAPLPSPVLRLVERRLLTAPAAPPAGTAEASLIGLRTEKLAALGDNAAADGLLKLIPAKLDDEGLARLAQDQLWLENRTKEACDALDQGAARYRGPYWQQNHVACQAIAGQKNESQLGANLLREQGLDDPIFFALIDGWGAAKQPQALPAGPLSALDAALALTAKRDIPAILMSSADVRVAAALATSQAQSPPARLAAAERAASVGAIDAEALAQAYLASEPTSGELNKFAAVVKNASSSGRSRALVYRGIKIEPSPRERGDLIAAVLEATRGSDLYAATAQLYRPFLAQLHPSGELAPHAIDFARALFVVGDTEQARLWFEYARSSGADTPDAPRLWAYARLAGVRDASAPDAKTLNAWREADATHDADASSARRALLLAMLGGLGDAIPGDAYLPFADPAQRSIPIVTNAQSWQQMREAAANPRLAETACLALINSGGRAGGTGDVIVIGAILSSLRAVGLEAEARAYAVEVAAAAGL